MNTETSAVDEQEIPVRYEIGGEVQYFEKIKSRLVRRFLLSQTKKLRKKHAYLRDKRDSDGNRATLVVQQKHVGALNITCIVEYPESLAGEVKDAEKAERIA